MTTQQEESLNRAIAEHDGWEPVHLSNGELSCFENKEGKRKQSFNYTSDLNVIVGVVQRWIISKSRFAETAKDSDNFCPKFTIEFGDYQTCVTFWEVYHDKLITEARHKQPALALCIAFARAARLEWEGE